MYKNLNTQTNLELINRSSSLKEGENSQRYRETNMGFTPPNPQETIRESGVDQVVGYITNTFVHGTKVGNLYDFRFKYSLNGEFPDLPFLTRDRDIYDSYHIQLQATPGWQQLGANAPPPFVSAVIDSREIGFKIIQITILECQPYESVNIETDKKEKCSEVYQNGINNYKLEQYERAIADFDEAIRLDPDNTIGYHPHIHYWRGQAKCQLQQYADAIPDFDEAIHLDFNNTTGYLSYMYCWRGQAKCQLQQYADAIPDFDEVIRLDPNDITTNLRLAYYWRGFAKKNLGDPNAANQDFQMALQLATEVGDTRLIAQIIMEEHFQL